MISFNASQRFFLYRAGTDMRKSFDSLSSLVSRELRMSVTTGDVFIFLNKPRNKIKLLVWDRSGFVIWYKRLETGSFELPSIAGNEKKLMIPWEDLVMLLEGIELQSVKRRKRFAYQQM